MYFLFVSWENKRVNIEVRERIKKHFEMKSGKETLKFTDTYSPSKRIYEAVKRIPRGCVATYAQVAEAAGNRKMARAVGNALHRNPDPSTIPCHRVVNAKGELAGKYAFGGAGRQAELLVSEGVEVEDGRVDLERFQWREHAVQLKGKR